MSENEIREPIQKRSIEKKEKIIQAGFELICDKGYYNTNTAEIAKHAGVSTGIVYQYFKDKHDIFIEGLKKYANHIFYPMINITTTTFEKENLDKLFREMIDSFIKTHKLSEAAHEEIFAMVHSDEEVAYLFHESEMKTTLALTNILIQNGLNKDNLKEKVHIAIGIIDNLCHEIVYHQHNDLNYDTMKELVIKNIINLLEN